MKQHKHVVMSIRLLLRIKNIIKQSKQETVGSTYRQRDDLLPEKKEKKKKNWHKTSSASRKMDQMTGSVQPLILPVVHMPTRTAKTTVSSKILIGCLKRLKL